MLNNVANKILLNILGAEKSYPTFSPLKLFGKFIKDLKSIFEREKSFYMILGFVNSAVEIKLNVLRHYIMETA